LTVIRLDIIQQFQPSVVVPAALAQLRHFNPITTSCHAGHTTATSSVLLCSATFTASANIAVTDVRFLATGHQLSALRNRHSAIQPLRCRCSLVPHSTQHSAGSLIDLGSRPRYQQFLLSQIGSSNIIYHAASSSAHLQFVHISSHYATGPLDSSYSAHSVYSIGAHSMQSAYSVYFIPIQLCQPSMFSTFSSQASASSVKDI